MRGVTPSTLKIKRAGMFHYEIKLYAFVLDYCHKLTDDIAEADMAHQPMAGVNSPVWILGHLAISTDYAAMLLGQSKDCPEEWHRRFGPGSTPPRSDEPRPTKAKLLYAIDRGHERVAHAAEKVTAARLAERHPVDLAFLRESLPTVGELLAHLMTTHPAAHLGQLSAWRRMRGMPGVLVL
jgi:hypothetical protein